MVETHTEKHSNSPRAADLAECAGVKAAMLNDKPSTQRIALTMSAKQPWRGASSGHKG